MSNHKIYSHFKLVIFSLLLVIIFPSKCWAFVIQKAYKISGVDIPRVSSEIHFHLHQKKHKLITKDPKTGFYYYYGCALGMCPQNNYVITAVKKTGNDVYLCTKNSYNGSTYKKQLLSHLKKNGLKYKKVKDKNLLETLAKYTDELVSNYKFANFYEEEKPKQETEDTTYINEEPEPQPISNIRSVPQPAQNTPARYSYNNTNREVSKVGKIFNEVKDGVVTIISIGHGSGFLVDKRGLILTNYHVVKAVDNENLRIRFGQNQIVTGKVVATDPQNDAAVIWVNLQNIKNYKVLKLAHNNPIVVMGEKILAIGSPLNWEEMEKTLTQGVVSKCDKSVIMHDANIDGGNSGGPLLNYGGYVVGINTFYPNSSRGLSGSVPINKAYNVLNIAKAKMAKITRPSSQLMPDVNSIPYSTKILEQAYYQSDKKTKKRDEPYIIHAGSNFDIRIITPAMPYRAIANKDKRAMKKFIKRQKKNGSEVTDDEYDSKNMAYYNNFKPVVRVEIIPKPKLTASSTAVNLLSSSASITTAALTGVFVPTPSYKNYTFAKDFKSLKLLNIRTGKSYTPYTSGRQLFTVDDAQQAGLSYAKFSDKSYVGVYEFDPKIFKTTDELIFNVYYSKVDPPISKTIKDKIKNYIVEDFQPYWDYLKHQPFSKIQNAKNKNHYQQFISDSPLQAYVRRIQTKIKSNWNPPRFKKSKKIEVIFKIDRQGNLLKIKTLQSSGNKNADKKAYEAIRNSTPFEPIPQSECNSRTIDIKFSFDYNVFEKNDVKH